jgi:hypothetical protein
MNTYRIVPATNDVTDSTLKSAPERTLAFLNGASDPAIRTALAAVGWSSEHVEEAMRLIAGVHGVGVVAPKVDPTVEAIAACEAWLTAEFVRARARLQLSFPEQALFLFHDLVGGKGSEAVLDVKTFLERRHELENSAARKATRKVDHEALALLAAVGVTKAEVKRLGELVTTAQAVVAQEIDEASVKRVEALRKIYAWVTAWSEIARTVITRRHQLIRLGIAKRRSTKAKSAIVAPVAAPPAVAAPPPVAAPPVAAPPAVAAPNTPAPPAVVAPADANKIIHEEEVAPESSAA